MAEGLQATLDRLRGDLQEWRATERTHLETARHAGGQANLTEKAIVALAALLNVPSAVESAPGLAADVKAEPSLFARASALHKRKRRGGVTDAILAHVGAHRGIAKGALVDALELLNPTEALDPRKLYSTRIHQLLDPEDGRLVVNSENCIELGATHDSARPRNFPGPGQAESHLTLYPERNA